MFRKLVIIGNLVACMFALICHSTTALAETEITLYGINFECEGCAVIGNGECERNWFGNQTIIGCAELFGQLLKERISTESGIKSIAIRDAYRALLSSLLAPEVYVDLLRVLKTSEAGKVLFEEALLEVSSVSPIAIAISVESGIVDNVSARVLRARIDLYDSRNRSILIAVISKWPDTALSLLNETIAKSNAQKSIKQIKAFSDATEAAGISNLKDIDKVARSIDVCTKRVEASYEKDCNGELNKVNNSFLKKLSEEIIAKWVYQNLAHQLNIENRFILLAHNAVRLKENGLLYRSLQDSVTTMHLEYPIAVYRALTGKGSALLKESFHEIPYIETAFVREMQSVILSALENKDFEIAGILAIACSRLSTIFVAESSDIYADLLQENLSSKTHNTLTSIAESAPINVKDFYLAAIVCTIFILVILATREFVARRRITVVANLQKKRGLAQRYKRSVEILQSKSWNDELNNLLQSFGLPYNATREKLRKSFTRMAKSVHPDTGTGDRNAFIALEEMYRRADKLIEQPERKNPHSKTTQSQAS